MKILTLISFMLCSFSLFAQTNSPKSILHNQSSVTEVKERPYQPGTAKQIKELTGTVTENNSSVGTDPIPVDPSGNVVTSRIINQSPRRTKVEELNINVQEKAIIK
jgi:hypothetical protein